MSSIFTPTQVCDPAKEKDWAYQLGIMDWDDTKIVFTKRSLVEFLRYTGTTVDPNLANIQKLPRYAQFGKMNSAGVAPNPASPSQDALSSSESDAFRPTRRVREAPGGTSTIGDLFSETYKDDALSAAPSSESVPAEAAAAEPASSHEAKAAPSVPTGDSVANLLASYDEEPAAQPEQAFTGEDKIISPIPGFKPTRRVRQAPGGGSSISLFDGGEPDEFVPTRRVREAPGGRDGLEKLF